MFAHNNSICCIVDHIQIKIYANIYPYFVQI